MAGLVAVCVLLDPLAAANAAAPTTTGVRALSHTAVTRTVAAKTPDLADPACATPPPPPGKPAPRGHHPGGTPSAHGRPGGGTLAETGAGRSTPVLLTAVGLLLAGTVLRAAGRRRGPA